MDGYENDEILSQYLIFMPIILYTDVIVFLILFSVGSSRFVATQSMTENDLMMELIPQSTLSKAHWAKHKFENWQIWKMCVTSVVIPDLLLMILDELNVHVSDFIREVRKIGNISV